MSYSDTPLINAREWIGVWVRSRSGPTHRGTVIHVEPWHRVRKVSPSGDRLELVCRTASLRGLCWPAGGGRLEIARPFSPSDLPGAVCRRCDTFVERSDEEIELLVPDDETLDDLADRVARRLLDRTPEGSP